MIACNVWMWVGNNYSSLSTPAYKSNSSTTRANCSKVTRQPFTNYILVPCTTIHSRHFPSCAARNPIGFAKLLGYVKVTEVARQEILYYLSFRLYSVRQQRF